jgi:hypothetical protein
VSFLRDEFGFYPLALTETRMASRAEANSPELARSEVVFSSNAYHRNAPLIGFSPSEALEHLDIFRDPVIEEDYLKSHNLIRR